MKTQKTISRKMQLGLAIAILVSAVLFMASCKKEDVHPYIASGNPVQAETNAKQVAPNHLTIDFKSITIDHRTNSNQPDYSITVYDNGTMWFDGRKNVKVRGKHELEVSEQAMYRINGLFNQFLKISQPEIKNNGITASESEKLVYENLVVTAYVGQHEGEFGKFMDYDRGQPVWLVTFRTEVEKALEINSLIHQSVKQSWQAQVAE